MAEIPGFTTASAGQNAGSIESFVNPARQIEDPLSYGFPYHGDIFVPPKTGSQDDVAIRAARATIDAYAKQTNERDPLSNRPWSQIVGQVV